MLRSPAAAGRHTLSMRRGRVLALSLLILAGAATLVYLRLHSGDRAGASSAAHTRATGQAVQRIAGSSAAALPSGSEGATHLAQASMSFNQRLRCTQIRVFLKRKMPPGELALLCARKPLGVLQLEAPLAQAGDPHAIEVIGWLANGGRCDFLTVAATLAGHRARMLALAQKNAATPQTMQRLDALLAEEEQGPTAEELEACRQSAEVLKKLQPGMIQQLVGVLGRGSAGVAYPRGPCCPGVPRLLSRSARRGALRLGLVPATPARRGMFRSGGLRRMGHISPSAAGSHGDVPGRRRGGAGRCRGASREAAGSNTRAARL